MLLLGVELVSTTEWVSSRPWLTAMAATTGWLLTVATMLRGGLRPWDRRRVDLGCTSSSARATGLDGPGIAWRARGNLLALRLAGF